ncbi:MAG: GtrA family protein [Ignavibacteria bacterium]|nr:GtrA family protein [Ignavibacteria bacterium]
MNTQGIISPILFGKFVSTNLIGTVVDTLALWVLVTFAFDTYLERYVLAPTISFQIAVLNNYSLSYFWTWKGRVKKTVRDYFQKLFFYTINCVLVFLLKLALLVAISALLDLHVVFCNLLALTITGLVNFALQDRLIFRQQKKAG